MYSTLLPCLPYKAESCGCSTCRVRSGIIIFTFHIIYYGITIFDDASMVHCAL